MDQTTTTRRFNRRRRAVQPNPHANAENLVPLTFKNMEFGPAEFMTTNHISKRNGLPLTRFCAIDPVNGNTIVINVQCQLRDLTHKAYEALEAGLKPTIKFVGGTFGGKDFGTHGATIVFAKNLDIVFPQVPASALETAVVAAGQQAEKSLSNTIQ